MRLKGIEKTIINLLLSNPLKDCDRKNKNLNLKNMINELRFYFVGFSLDYFHNLFKENGKKLDNKTLLVLLWNLKNHSNLIHFKQSYNNHFRFKVYSDCFGIEKDWFFPNQNITFKDNV